MSARTESRVRPAWVILLLLIAVWTAPLLDDLAGFLSEAPYVPYLPLISERARDAGLTGVLTSAWNALSTWGNQPPI